MTTEEVKGWPVGLKSIDESVESGDEVLLKHVNAIALMPVKGGKKISVTGRKLFNVLLHHSMSNPDLMEHEMKMAELIKITNNSITNYEHIKKTLRELMVTTVEWQSPSKNEFVEIWEASNLLSGVGLIKDKKNETITIKWRFDSKIREDILRPEIYSRLSIESITQFSTHPAMALYEICARYVTNPSHLTSRKNWKTWWMPVLTGVTNNTNKAEYRFFNRDILKKAIAEVNAKTNLQITGPIEYKEANNRTVVDIQFEVRYKTTSAPAIPLINNSEQELPVIGRAINLGIKQKQIEKILTQYTLEIIVCGLDELEKRLEIPESKVGKLERPVSWLNAVLKKINAEAKPKFNPAASAMAQFKPASLEEQRAEWVKEWVHIQRENLLFAFQDSPQEKRQEIVKAFGIFLEATDKKTVLKKYYDFMKFNESIENKHCISTNKLLSAALVGYLGISQRGPNWDKPTAEDLLSIAAKALAKQAP